MNNLPTLPSIDVNRYNGWAIEAEQIAKKIEVKDDNTEAIATEAFLKIKKFIKDADTERADYKEPFLKMCKAIDGTYKTFIERFKIASDELEQKILMWRKKKEQILREAEEKARAEFEAKLKAEEKKVAKNPLLEPEYIPPPTTYIQENIKRTDAGSASERKIWTFELLDLSKVPLQYLQLNEKSVNEAIREGERNISGLRIYQITKLSGRTV